MYLSQIFAEFIEKTSFESLPQQVVSLAKERIMDTLGAAAAGSTNWEYRDSFKIACRRLGSGNLSVIGDTKKEFSPAVTAMINAVYAHAIELDDGHKNAGCHAGAVVVPVALALAQALGKTGKDVITAVAIGYEVTYRIASHVNPVQIRKGFHPSSNCGVFGAAAAAGKLLGLNKDQLANCLGQAAMFASGTMEATKSGQRAKCVQVGHSAFSGIMAAYTAQVDMEGCLSAFEGSTGFFQTQSESVDLEDLCRDLGKTFSIGDTYNKMYPCCRHAQPGIEAVIDMSKEYQILPEQVEKIWIGTHKVAFDLTGHIQRPQNSGEAKFSLAYGSAVAMYEHNFGVLHLSERYYQNEQILDLAEKTICQIDEDVQSLFPKKRGAKVRVTLKNGTQYEKELYDLKGSPENPIGWIELAEKFRSSTLSFMEPDMVEQTLSRLASLEMCSCINEVTTAFVHSGKEIQKK